MVPFHEKKKDFKTWVSNCPFPIKDVINCLVSNCPVNNCPVSNCLMSYCLVSKCPHTNEFDGDISSWFLEIQLLNATIMLLYITTEINYMLQIIGCMKQCINT